MWPGASRMVYRRLSVSNLARPTCTRGETGEAQPPGEGWHLPPPQQRLHPPPAPTQRSGVSPPSGPLGRARARPHLHGDALDPLLLVGVHDVGHVPALAVLVLGLALVLLNRALVNLWRRGGGCRQGGKAWAGLLSMAQLAPPARAPAPAASGSPCSNVHRRPPAPHGAAPRCCAHNHPPQQGLPCPAPGPPRAWSVTNRICPPSVLLPASTWPMNTTLRWSRGSWGGAGGGGGGGRGVEYQCANAGTRVRACAHRHASASASGTARCGCKAVGLYRKVHLPT